MSRQTDTLDAFFGPHDPPELTPAAWRIVRLAWREHMRDFRRASRISSNTLPAVGDAAQHAVAARDHAQKAIEAMRGITGPQSEPPPPPDDEKK